MPECNWYQDIMDGKRERNHLLDSLKGIACIFVVFIHVPFPGKAGIAVTALAGFAVPLFLMTSGYYAFGCPSGIIKKRMIRVFKIAVLACILYFLMSVVYCAIFDSWHDFIGTLKNPKTWASLVFLQDFDFIRAGHLWFLPALGLAYLVLFLAQKHGFDDKVHILIIPLFICTLLISTITMTNDGNHHLRDNFIFYALPYFLLGNYIAENRERFVRLLKNEWLITAAIIGAAFNVFCMELPLSPNLYQLGASANAVSLFLLAVKNPSLSCGSFFERTGSDYSLYVYVLHLAIGGALQALIKMPGWIVPVLTAAMSLLAAAVIHKILFKINQN